MIQRRTPLPKLSPKRQAARDASGVRSNSTILQRSPRPSRMCRACHAEGTQRNFPKCDTHSSPAPIVALGVCGQCGKRRQLLECHQYDFRHRAIKKVNAERLAKRRKSYAQKLAAYKRSETYRIVEARAEGRCEGVTRYENAWKDSCGYPRRDVQHVRCHREEESGGKKFAHHHYTYVRFGGNELPGDMRKLCDPCHAVEEAKHPNRRRGR